MRLCEFPGCGRKHECRGYCPGHNAQLRRGEELKPITIVRKSKKRVCQFPECDRPHASRGYCGAHYRQFRKGEELRPIGLQRVHVRQPCEFPDCGRERTARGYCSGHYQQLMRSAELRPLEVRTTQRPGMSSRHPARLHNVTLEWYEEAILRGCEICGSTERLAIDHDHTCCPGANSCGECVRGILCHYHNMALGLFQDNPDHLIAAAFYLSKFTQEQSQTA